MQKTYAALDSMAVAVEVDPHPLVRIGGVRVSQIKAAIDPAILGSERGDSRHRSVDV